MTFCQSDRSMAPICEVDETMIKVASRCSKTHMRWPSHNATKILCARTFTFQFKLLGFSFTSLTHFRSPLANFADRVITKKKHHHPLYMYNI
ncbi:hypothetical protein YC2023_037772 [Brassica napus]